MWWIPGYVITLEDLKPVLGSFFLSWISEDKEEFLQWLRMALQWNPEDWPTALEFPWGVWRSVVYSIPWWYRSPIPLVCNIDRYS